MRDSFGREITYMRVSVTDLCNLRCRYCAPGVQRKRHDEIMSEEEILALIKTASELGIRKIRFTGGEPLLRKNIVALCRMTRDIPGIHEVCITTNGILLPPLAESLRASGVDRVNISLDTLRPERYSYITRGGVLDDALRGIESALGAGFRVKVNAVLVNGFNDDEIPELAGLTLRRDIDVRFIELMPMVEGFSDGYLTANRICDSLPELEALGFDGTAKLFRLKRATGRIGIISPISSSFCDSCNRLRLTADGYIKPCLHSGTEIFVRHKTKAELKQLITLAVTAKPRSHNLNVNHSTESSRTMSRIGG